MAKGWVTLNDREQIRLMILNEVFQGLRTREEAAAALQVSTRQVRRLLAAYREEGARAMAHGNRGRTPANAVSEAVRQRIVALARGELHDVNDCHLTDLLARLPEPVSLSRSTVRRILRDAGLHSPQKRRASKHRQRRERRPRAGMLLLLDASPHRWLMERGPSFTLVGCIDDATNEVPYARFQVAEDTLGYFRLMRHVAARHGVPEAVYVDRHAIFVNITDATLSVDEQLRGARGRPTQFAALLERLHVAAIHAHSPQAKGRIERLWRTFQDRLVVELRLAGARTLEDANTVLDAFLPTYNRQFAVPPTDPATAFRPAPDHLDDLFTLRWTRTVAPDHTVRHERRHWQLTPSPGERSYVRCRVEVWQHLDGHFSLHHGDRSLPFRPAPPPAPQLRQEAAAPRSAPPQPDPIQRTTPKAPQKPPKDHPWRKAAEAQIRRRTFSLNR